jgi:hypothetical protein
MTSTFAITVRAHIKERDYYAIKLRNILTDETFRLLIFQDHPLHSKIKAVHETKNIDKEIYIDKLVFEGVIRTEIIAESFIYSPKNISDNTV